MNELTSVAATIGALYRKARSSHLESVNYLLEAGRKLRDQKAALPHGDWLLWVKDHQDELGFGDDTAQKLMRGALEYANTASTRFLSDEEASAINRAIWRNAPEPSPYPQLPSLGYMAKFADWTQKHDVNEFVQYIENPEEVRARIAMARAWLEQLERAIRPQLKAVS